jgi:hypothetical protein
MSRPFWSLLAATIVLASAPPTPAVGDEHSSSHSSSHSSGYSYGYSTTENRDDDFGWVIVDGEQTSMSAMDDMESVNDLKDRFGDNFLYIRDGKDHYVITDEELVARGRRAGLSMKYYGKQLGMLARDRAQGARGSEKYARKMAAIGKLQADLGRELARRSLNGESTEKQRREMEDLTEQMDELRSDMQKSQNTGVNSEEMDHRIDELSKKVKKAAREAEEEMHDILHDAKAQHLAKRVN